MYVEKTKVVIFRRGGLKINEEFTINNVQVAIENSYHYLGILFSNLGVSATNIKEMCYLMRSLSKTKWSSWRSRMLLFKAHCECAFYACKLLLFFFNT